MFSQASVCPQERRGLPLEREGSAFGGKGVCMEGERGQTPPPPPADIQSTGSWYVSYWNTFLLNQILTGIVTYHLSIFFKASFMRFFRFYINEEKISR